MTPSGSFHGSKRETWSSSGRAGSTPNWSTMNAASCSASAMFLGASGSIAGGWITTGGSSVPAGTYSGMWKIAASYPRIAGSRKSSTSRFGVEMSMWQRQIQCACASGSSSRTNTGCGSWTITKSYSSISARSSSAFSAL